MRVANLVQNFEKSQTSERTGNSERVALASVTASSAVVLLF